MSAENLQGPSMRLAHGGGRGRGQPRQGMPMVMNEPIRRELRRPHGGNYADELSAQFGDLGFRQDDPSYQRYSQIPQPAPNVDGWSSGDNPFDPPSHGAPHFNMDHFRGSNLQQQQHQPRYQPQQRPPRQWNPGYRPQSGPKPPDPRRPYYGGREMNVGATEFVPKSMLSATAAEFVPRQSPHNTSNWAYVQKTDQYAGGVQQNYDPMEEVTKTISNLEFSPADLEVSAQHLAEVLNVSVYDQETLQRVVYRIFEKCLTEQNFLYTGARLLAYLASTVSISADGKSLSDTLLNMCEGHHNSRKNLLDSNAARFRSLTLLMSELFLQLRLYNESTRQIAQVLANDLLELLLLAVEVKEKETLKNLIQVLKMAGQALEEEEKLKKSGVCPDMDKLIDKLQKLAASNESKPSEAVPQNVLQMISDVIAARKDGWRAFEVSNESDGTNNSMMAGAATSAATAEGELTLEELQFMAEQLGEDFGFDDQAEPEMDPEIEAAFEEFMKTQSS